MWVVGKIGSRTVGEEEAIVFEGGGCGCGGVI